VLEKKVWGTFGPEGKIWQKNGKNYLMKSFIILFLFKYWDDQNKDD